MMNFAIILLLSSSFRKEEEVPTPPEPNPPSEMGGELVEGEEQVPE